MTNLEQSGRERSMNFSDYRRALTREILLTERLRVKAVLAADNFADGVLSDRSAGTTRGKPHCRVSTPIRP
jgi:hypothetical protein